MLEERLSRLVREKLQPRAESVDGLVMVSVDDETLERLVEEAMLETGLKGKQLVRALHAALSALGIHVGPKKLHRLAREVEWRWRRRRYVSA